MRKLRQHIGVQLDAGSATMNATRQPATPGLHAAAPARKENGFLHIARFGNGAASTYVVTYHRLGRPPGAAPKPAAAEGAQALLELLEEIGVDFRLGEVRGALTDILRFGSANIPNLWLSDEELFRKGLAGGS